MRYMRWLIFFICCLPIFFSCGQKEKSGYTPPADALFVQVPQNETGVEFINTVEDGKDYNILTYRNFYNGGGVAAGDINNDGLPDIFLTANLEKSKLFLNEGNFKFRDITPGSGIVSKRGWRTGVTFADVNADGWLDVYICNSGDIKGANKENELYINQHNNTFKEQAKQYGLNDPGYTTHVSFFDYDLDGDLDCYVLNNSFVDVQKFDVVAARSVLDTMGGHKLLRNDNGHFKNVSTGAGIASIKISYGLGVSVSDVNGDMYPDIFISNDFYEKDYLYINQKNGTFKDEMAERMGHISSSSMGADIADLNNDGYMDIVTTDMLPEDEYRVKTMTRFEEYHVEDMKFRYNFHYQYPQNTLQLNNGDGTFRETAFMSGIAATDWSWGALTFDFDNDGYRDIYISNGVYRDISDLDFSEFLANKAIVKKIVDKKGHFDFRDFLPYVPTIKIPNYGYINQRNLTFKNESAALGLGVPSFSNGVAYADLDNDGDFDLIVNNLNDPCFIYRNETNKIKGNHYLKINLKGQSLNPFGVGAWLNLYSNGEKQVIQNFPVRSFQSCVDPKLIFGLGKNLKVDSLEVIWPDLTKQTLYNLTADREITLQQKDADKKFIPAVTGMGFLFTDITSKYLKDTVRHKENSYVDFDVEKLIPYMLSTQGPKMAKADVNGDGLEDIYIGGAVDNPGKLLIQTTSGFTFSKQDVFSRESEKEDAGVSFFDADKDGDFDLLVASGGYQYDQGSSLLAARLYLNDGKGKFSNGVLPGIFTNASCVKTIDFDNDGYTDVFIGGRAVAGNYGLPGRSYLLHNEKGVLTDRTPDVLKEPGMVTDVAFSDFNNDNYPDMILVGDWMPVTFINNNKGNFENKTVVENSAGWWNCIEAVDIDRDGDMDYILGNWGLNSRLKASPEKPMELYVNDFDNNGTPECILTYFWPDGKSHLFNSKSDITSRLPALKKKFLLYKDFAGKSISDIIGNDMVKKSLHLKVETLASSVLINNGNNSFRLVPLPEMAQLAPVFKVIDGDFNDDNFTDILLAGNFFDIKPDIGRLDANAACMFTGNGKGEFKYVPKQTSGLNLHGQYRDALTISVKQKKIIILAGNNNPLVFLETKK